MATKEEGKKTVTKAKPTAKKAPAKAAAAVKTAEKTAKAEAKVQKPAAKKAPKLEIIVQSPMGGNITTDEIAKKLPEGVESVFVRVDQNKLWWIRGEETGSVDIW